MNVTVWNEHVAEREKPEADRIYPGGMHATIAAALADVGTVRTATLAERDHGLPPEVLDSTDVLHSGHFSKPFKRLMGTRCTLRWRHDERETVWTVAPGHPIAAGVPECFVIPEQEMYGEFFDVPPPDELVFISSSRAARCFAAAAAGPAAAAGSSTSAPGTRRTRSTTSRRSSGCWSTPSAGRSRCRRSKGVRPIARGAPALDAPPWDA